jgi:hypothetical protein
MVVWASFNRVKGEGGGASERVGSPRSGASQGGRAGGTGVEVAAAAEVKAAAEDMTVVDRSRLIPCKSKVV